MQLKEFEIIKQPTNIKDLLHKTTGKGGKAVLE